MKRLKNIKLKYQIINLIGISIFLIISLQALNFVRIYSLMHTKARIYSNNSINQVEESLKVSINNVREAGYKVAYNIFVQEYLITGVSARKIELKKFVDNLVSSVIDTNDSIYGVGIIKQNGDWSGFHGSLDYIMYSGLKDKVDFLNNEFNQPLFTTIVSNNEFYYAYIVPVFSIEYKTEIKNRIGTVLILCKTKTVKTIFNKIAENQGSRFIVLDKDSLVIASNLVSLEGKVIEKNHQYIKGNNKVLVQDRVLEDIDWKIISIMTINEITSDMNFFRSVVIITGIIMIVLILGIGFVINHNITKPIVMIVNSMRQIGIKNIKQRLNLPAKGEIGIIVEDINQMLDKIEKMTQQDIEIHRNLFEMRLSKKQAELSALQSQINPHFMYNTLECMRSIGLAYDSDEIVEISTAMAEIFRYSIKGNNFVKVKQEIEIIKEYLKIMNLRFRDKFFAVISIAEELMDKEIIKMSLQPIVENAIYHGLENKAGKGRLLVEGKIEDKLIIFKIIDNGKGIEKRELDKLKYDLNNVLDKNVQIEEKRSIGLININKRIKLYLGIKYGLNIKSKKNEGTEVTVVLPVILNDKIK